MSDQPTTKPIRESEQASERVPKSGELRLQDIFEKEGARYLSERLGFDDKCVVALNESGRQLFVNYGTGQRFQLIEYEPDTGENPTIWELDIREHRVHGRCQCPNCGVKNP